MTPDKDGRMTFDEAMAKTPEIFDSQDCVTGRSRLDDDYSDSVVPAHCREEVLAFRRKAREARRKAEQEAAKKP